MAFFSNGDDRTKLMLLFILKQYGFSMSREQLSTIMADHGADNYFDVNDKLLSLEKDGFVAAVPVHGFQMLAITARGEELIGLFEQNLPMSLRSALSGYIEEHRDEFKRANTSRITVVPLAGGGYGAKFTLIERSDVLFEVSLKLPDAAYMRAAERNWERIAGELYLSTLRRLTERGEDSANDTTKT